MTLAADSTCQSCGCSDVYTAAPHDLVADPTPCSRNFDMGHVLTLARLSDRHRNRILLFRGYIHDPWLRRCVAGQVMATARTSRRLNGRPHVRFVHRLLLRQRESNLSIAVGEIHRYFCFRRIGVRRGPTGAPASRIKNSCLWAGEFFVARFRDVKHLRQ